MKRLSGTDAMFLVGETPTWHQHIGGVSIVDPTNAPDFSFERILELLRERLPLSPKFAWKLKEIPGGLDRPVWVDDPDFDVDDHFIKAACPRPGDMRALSDMVGRIMSHQLDRRRPLWEAWLIEGIEGGRVAIVVKFHHALADGISGMALADQLFDIEPDPPPRAGIPPLASAGAPPSDLALLAQSLWPPGRTPIRIARYLTQQAARIVSLRSMLTGDDRVTTPLDAPKVSWNGELGPRRKLSFGAVSLKDVKRVKDHFGVKVNDVVLALVGGTLRRYLLEHDELPDKPLVASVPVSLRAEGDTEMTNKISNVFASMGTNVDDPGERLRAVHRSTQAAKKMQSALRARQVQSLGEIAPPMLLSLASRTLWANRIEAVMPVQINAVVSNVPGPDFPLYVAGAKVEGIFPTAPVMVGVGLNATLVSYMDQINVGFHVDADLVDDPWTLIAGLQPSLDELVAAIES
jgi:WS/DGAT/MGAT family acyltransferase